MVDVFLVRYVAAKGCIRPAVSWLAAKDNILMRTRTFPQPARIRKRYFSCETDIYVVIKWLIRTVGTHLAGYCCETFFPKRNSEPSCKSMNTAVDVALVSHLPPLVWMKGRLPYRCIMARRTTAACVMPSQVASFVMQSHSHAWNLIERASSLRSGFDLVAIMVAILLPSITQVKHFLLPSITFFCLT